MPEPTTSAPAKTRSNDKILWGVFGAAIVACAVLVAVTPYYPPPEQLGHWLKLVLFHGASTWVNLATFTLAGILAVAYLATRRPGVYAYTAATRYVSFSLWIFNTALGMASAWLTWGSGFMGEPRLRWSFVILLALAVAMAFDILADKPVLHASIDIAIALGVWAFVLFTPREIHPQSPVMASGWDVKGVFAGMVLMWGAAMVVAIRLWAERLKAGGAGVPGMPDETD
jgi:hypothetical protein